MEIIVHYLKLSKVVCKDGIIRTLIQKKEQKEFRRRGLVLFGLVLVWDFRYRD